MVFLVLLKDGLSLLFFTSLLSENNYSKNIICISLITSFINSNLSHDFAYVMRQRPFSRIIINILLLFVLAYIGSHLSNLKNNTYTIWSADPRRKREYDVWEVSSRQL